MAQRPADSSLAERIILYDYAIEEGRKVNKLLTIEEDQLMFMHQLEESKSMLMFSSLLRYVNT